MSILISRYIYIYMEILFGGVLLSSTFNNAHRFGILKLESYLYYDLVNTTNQGFSPGSWLFNIYHTTPFIPSRKDFALS